MDSASLERLSLNQATVEQWSLREAVDGCARHGIGWIGPWRHKVAELGVTASARLIRDAGLRVSSLCRGGWFPAATAIERQARIDDNLRAVEEAAELGTDVLVLVCGPAPDRDLAGAREMVAEGVAAVVERAYACSVRLAIEPLHPMFAGDRSVIVTLAEALDLAERIGADWDVGVVVDAYHVWWDPAIEAQIARAGARILGYHVSDWLVPPPDPLLGRGMMGDGVIDLRHLRGVVEAAGYAGPIEVEIFNRDLREAPGEDVLTLLEERFLAVV